MATATETIARETFRSIGEQAQRLPGHPAVSTIWRWAETGIRGVKLEVTRVGWRKYVSDEAIERFLTAINE